MNELSGWTACSAADGDVFARNINKTVLVAGQKAILNYSRAFRVHSSGEEHRVHLDFFSDHELADGPSDEECQRLIEALFSRRIGG